MSPSCLPEEDNLPHNLVGLVGLASELLDFQFFKVRLASVTPNKYFSWPNRSRYLLQNGKVPKFLLMTPRSFCAEARFGLDLGASCLFA